MCIYKLNCHTIKSLLGEERFWHLFKIIKANPVVIALYMPPVIVLSIETQASIMKYIVIYCVTYEPNVLEMGWYMHQS